MKLKSNISKDGIMFLSATFVFFSFIIWVSRNHLLACCLLCIIAFVLVLLELKLLVIYCFQDEFVVISSVFKKKILYYNEIHEVYYSSGGRGDGPYIHVQSPSVFHSGCRFNNEDNYFIVLKILTDHGAEIIFKGYDKKAQKEILRQIAAVSL